MLITNNTTDSISINTPTTSTITYPINYDSILMPTTSTYSINWDEYKNFLNSDEYKNVLHSLDNYFTIKDSEAIKEIVELVPQKVYKIIFYSGKSVKTILDSHDTFDPEYMLFLAYAKMLYSKKLTFNGVLNKSYQLQYEKRYVKLVKDGLKLFKKIQKDKAKKEEEERIKKRRHEKLVAKKKTAKERKRKDKINLIAEAIRLSKEEG